MNKQSLHAFVEKDVLNELHHYLPALAPLKDFIHHNTLHAYQHLRFNKAIQQATHVFGYKTRLSLQVYRDLFNQGRINQSSLELVIKRHFPQSQESPWKKRMIEDYYAPSIEPKIGRLRGLWKGHYKIDLDNGVHPILFRLLCSYLDQGIAITPFPLQSKGLLEAVREMESKTHNNLFNTSRAQLLLANPQTQLKEVLSIIVGDEAYFEQYLFDQQFAHPGWSGMVATIERQPATLLDRRQISLRDFILLELLFELDFIDYTLGENWKPLSDFAPAPIHFFEDIPESEFEIVLSLWQEAYEWTYYDEVLAGIQHNTQSDNRSGSKSFQAMFCIDDRECSIRRHVEEVDPNCETFGTPGFFGVEFYYQPENGKFVTKLCPAPVTPKYLIKEIDSTHKHDRDIHLTKHTHSLVSGWLISQTVGFWSALRLFFNIFKPTMSPATATSLRHMDQFSKLTIEHEGKFENELQVGFTIDEMVVRAEGLLKSIGLTKHFAQLVYIMGHGSSSVNNPHYAAYDCGACSGRPGSVNARVAAFMANHPKVRQLLKERGIEIPSSTRFVASLHDTTRDEMVFYDEEHLSPEQLSKHLSYKKVFEKALDMNAKERSRKFDVVRTHRKAEVVHEQVKKRSVSLFEPRPELNHATNALCIVGSRRLTRNLFLDRRAFMNSYDYSIDPTGTYLFSILKAAAPVCGGINLEYYFSRVDNNKLGAGTKLPHNVMGLIGVANGIDGDLRPGLPSQMIEVHDPIRLLMIVEHYPEVVLQTIKQHAETYEWFKNEWVHLVVSHPETHQYSRFRNEQFVPYSPLQVSTPITTNADALVESTADSIPVTIIQQTA